MATSINQNYELKFQVPAPITNFQINFQYFHVVCKNVAYIKLEMECGRLH
jgi:hypothetical protein